jgi:hypothetical protein
MMRQSKAAALSARTGAPVSGVDHTAAANRSSTGILPPNCRDTARHTGTFATQSAKS